MDILITYALFRGDRTALATGGGFVGCSRLQRLPQQQEPAGKQRTPQLSHPVAHGSSGSPPALPTTDSDHPRGLR